MDVQQSAIQEINMKHYYYLELAFYYYKLYFILFFCVTNVIWL